MARHRRSLFDAAIFIGYHASTTNATGVRAHTFSSGTLTRVALNGVEMTEGSWNAAIAGHFNVPIVMVSGDDAAIAEVRKVVGERWKAAETKTGARLPLGADAHAAGGAGDLIGLARAGGRFGTAGVR